MTLYGDAISKEVKTGIGQGAYPKFNGIGFPMGKRESNYVPKEYGNQLIKSQIKQLLLVNKGERVMLPNYGIGIRSYLFSNITPSDLAAIKLDIRDAIERYIPNATLLDLDVELAENYKFSGMDGLIIKVKIKANKLNEILDFTIEL